MTSKKASKRPPIHMIDTEADALTDLAIGAERRMPQVSALYLREPTAGDLRGVKLASLTQFDAGELLVLLPRIAMPRLSPAESAKLGLRDVINIGNAVAGFL